LGIYVTKLSAFDAGSHSDWQNNSVRPIKCSSSVQSMLGSAWT